MRVGGLMFLVFARRQLEVGYFVHDSEVHGGCHCGVVDECKDGFVSSSLRTFM
jgi:hypothetical protein